MASSFRCNPTFSALAPNRETRFSSGKSFAAVASPTPLRHEKNVCGTATRLLSCVLALASLNVGCEPASPSLPQVSQNTPKPVAEFDWIIKRLEHALDSFSPSGSYGLRAKRELDYELIPPSKSQTNYTARVTITSKTYYQPTFQATEKEGEPEVDPLAYDAILSDDPLEPPSPHESSSEDLDSPLIDLPIKKPLTQEAFVPMPSTGSKETFELAHLDGHWQVTTPIESDRARNWLDYALQNDPTIEKE